MRSRPDPGYGRIVGTRSRSLQEFSLTKDWENMWMAQPEAAFTRIYPTKRLKVEQSSPQSRRVWPTECGRSAISTT